MKFTFNWLWFIYIIFLLLIFASTISPLFIDHYQARQLVIITAFVLIVAFIILIAYPRAYSKLFKVLLDDKGKEKR